MFRLAAPVLFAALGEIFGEKSGVLNLGLEGAMITGAFVSFVFAYQFNSSWMGVLGGILGGAAVGLLFAVLTVTLGLDQMAIGLVITLTLTASASLLMRLIYMAPGKEIYPIFPTMGTVYIPILSDLPIVGQMLFGQDALLYLCLLLVACCYFIMFRTKWGLMVRAVGESAKAADVMGINVYRTKYLCVILSGLLGGVGGAYLTLVDVGSFREGMTMFRGFIAIVIVIFANWKPQNALPAALLFGFTDALQMRLQAFVIQVPYQFFLALPYIVVILFLVIAAKRGRLEVPTGLLEYYRRE
jgi:simple sugar transport system permease protein